MKILVTGAAGAVGSYAPEVFDGDELILTDVVQGFDALDIRDAETVRSRVGELAPDVVLHLAAATDVDLCEQDPDWAYHVNAIGTHNVALACREHDVLLVYTSTAGVFSGSKVEPYTEFDLPDPANVYGRSKLAGEHSVQALLPRSYTVRAGWMVGGGAKDKKFVGKILAQIAAGETLLRAVDDKLGSPTYAKELLLGIRDLLETGHYGLYHMVNAGICSRYDVAVELVAILGRDDVRVEPVSSAFFPLPAPRARSEAMINYKRRLQGADRMRPWRDALADYVRSEHGAALGGNAASQT